MDQREIQVNYIRFMFYPVVKGDIVGQIVEIPSLLLRGHNRAGHFPDIADTLLLALGHRLWGRVWAQIPTRSPDHNKFLILVIHYFDNRQVLRLYTFALIEHIFQIAVYFVRRNAFQGMNRPAVLFLDTDNKITSTPVVNIVGKSANGL